MKKSNDDIIISINKLNRLSLGKIEEQEMNIALYYMAALPTMIIWHIYSTLFSIMLVSCFLINFCSSIGIQVNVHGWLNSAVTFLVIGLISIPLAILIDKMLSILIRKSDIFNRIFNVDFSIMTLQKSIYTSEISNIFDLSFQPIQQVFKNNFELLKTDIMTNKGLSGETIYKLIKESKSEKVKQTPQLELPINLFLFSEIEIALKESNTRVGNLLQELDNIVNFKK